MTLWPLAARHAYSAALTLFGAGTGGLLLQVFGRDFSPGTEIGIGTALGFSAFLIRQTTKINREDAERAARREAAAEERETKLRADIAEAWEHVADLRAELRHCQDNYAALARKVGDLRRDP